MTTRQAPLPASASADEAGRAAHAAAMAGHDLVEGRCTCGYPGQSADMHYTAILRKATRAWDAAEAAFTN